MSRLEQFIGIDCARKSEIIQPEIERSGKQDHQAKFYKGFQFLTIDLSVKMGSNQDDKQQEKKHGRDNLLGGTTWLPPETDTKMKFSLMTKNLDIARVLFSDYFTLIGKFKILLK